ncbi:MAG TPA: heavy-metal-associated domain-containing protein [Gemmatimonadaceae bacterium]|nr:heavy-metal-associated domain-containing protein [Gemmatimonadaceae bacterium]
MRIMLQIPTLTSIHGIRAVQTALGALEGVTRADVHRGAAVVEHDGRLDAARIVEAVAVAGFEVTRCETDRRSLPLL